MKNCIFIIPGELTDLNTYINAERTNRYKAASIKKAETQRVWGELENQKVKPIKGIVEMICTWYTKDLKKDSDNVAFALKYILDGMVLAKVLPDDSRKYTGSIVHIFDVDAKKPRVEIDITQR